MKEALVAGSKLTAVQNGNHIPTTMPDLDRSLLLLNDNKNKWSSLSVSEIINLFESVLQNLTTIADEWVEKDIQNRGLTSAHWDAAVSYFGGPIMAIHTLRAYLQSLKDIERYGKPRLPGKITTKSNGQVAVQVYPTSLYEKILFNGFKGEVWLDTEITTSAEIAQAKNYFQPSHTGKVALVLGAGNVSALTINDTYHQLINERHVVMIKVHPVTEYLGELLEKIFEPLITRGFLQVVYGGVPEGVYLCQHELIDTIHITGSDKTYDNIVYGAGEIGLQNKQNRQPICSKKITSELGNVTPAIIIPGPWTQADIQYQAENLATTMTVNSGFNCISTRVIIQHESWQLRSQLMASLCEQLQHIPLCKSYYPGAQKRIAEIVTQKPEAKQIGIANASESPWTVIQNLEAANQDEECFRAEVFGGFTTETALKADSIPDYIANAVKFCHEQLWGNLAVMIIVHPASLKDPVIKAALDKAICDLRYGCISINHFPAIALAFGTTTWGGFPGNPPHAIQSGSGQVCNAFLIENAQKSVVSGFFKMIPKPAWFATNKKSVKIAKSLLDFEKKPTLRHFIKILFASIF